MMGFTVEDRYLRLPTSTTWKVLHLAKRENQRLAAANWATCQHTRFQSTGLSSMRLNCLLVCRGPPLPGSLLIVLSISLSEFWVH